MVYAFLLVFFNNFVPKMHRFWDIRLQKCCDLENRVREPSRSLEMSPCDRAHMTSYWRSIVTMALSHVVSEIFNVKKMSRHWNRGQRSLKVIESCTIRYNMYGFLLVFYSNFVPKTHRFLRYSTSKYTVTLKPGLWVTQGHRKLYHPIRHPWLPINVP